MKEVLSFLEDHNAEMLQDIERIVRTESPSGDRQAINPVQDVNEEVVRPIGERAPTCQRDPVTCCTCRSPAQAPTGWCCWRTWTRSTRWVRGRAPWRVEGDQAFGPGTYDMKAGAVQALWALRAAAGPAKEAGLHDRFAADGG